MQCVQKVSVLSLWRLNFWCLFEEASCQPLYSLLLPIRAWQCNVWNCYAAGILPLSALVFNVHWSIYTLSTQSLRKLCFLRQHVPPWIDLFNFFSVSRYLVALTLSTKIMPVGSLNTDLASFKTSTQFCLENQVPSHWMAKRTRWGVTYFHCL